MEVEIRQVKSRRLAVIQHRGDPRGMGLSVNKLITWAMNQPVNLKPSAGEVFGFAYDDPKTTKAEDFRYDMALTVPDNLVISDTEVFETWLPEGRYAIAVHFGAHHRIGETIYPMLQEWLPTSGETLGELPCLFCYQNFVYDVAESELITECWFQLAD